MRRRWMTGAGAVVMALTVGCSAGTGRGTVVVGEDGQDRAPSSTAEDWVTHADHVVVVTPSNFEEEKPPASALERGEGTIGRTATFAVDEVLWSAASPRKDAPSTVRMPVMGWEFTDGDTNNRRKMALAGQPRIEGGHSYIMAINWVDQYCSPGDSDYIPAQWTGLGADSIVPFDEGLIGKGEFEGRRQSVEQARARAASETSDQSLEDALAGKGSDSLTAALEAARPDSGGRLPEPQEDTDCG